MKRDWCVYDGPDKIVTYILRLQIDNKEPSSENIINLILENDLQNKYITIMFVSKNEAQENYRMYDIESNYVLIRLFSFKNEKLTPMCLNEDEHDGKKFIIVYTNSKFIPNNSKKIEA